jgi:hypothetical protein
MRNKICRSSDANQTNKELNLDDNDPCVMCGTLTEYKVREHIDMRLHYIEGGGQMCKECYDSTYPWWTI